ncbi:hypothetical protein [Streptomyces smyrnaeus]|uniref:hypothetical protein n=1 Tax=Streptomyces smyrnaeus TaxID=1387713 RepID=UPI00182FD465
MGALLSMYFGRRAKSSRDWLAAPASLPLGVVVFTQFATAVGGGVLIALVLGVPAGTWLGRTDIALAANSGAYNAGIAAGAARGGLVLHLADVRATFLAGGLLAVAACAVLLGGRSLPIGADRANAPASPAGRQRAARTTRPPDRTEHHSTPRGRSAAQ